MDWTRAVDGYCERLGPGLWAEPVNALTNLGFILVALWLWPRVAGVRGARVLCAVLLAIGVGSGVFHTFAQPWAGLLDVLPIAVFALVYVYLTGRGYFGGPPWAAALGVAAFLPFVALASWAVAALPVIGGSSVYVGINLAVALGALALWRREPEVARGLASAAGLLAVSITLRALDEPFCAHWPHGTHFGWHLLNAVLLGWMIVVYHAHVVAGRQAGR